LPYGYLPCGYEVAKRVTSVLFDSMIKIKLIRTKNILLQHISVFCIRRGWIQSPSLALSGEDPADFDAIIDEHSITWVRR
jgi:hypothetical protein